MDGLTHAKQLLNSLCIVYIANIFMPNVFSNFNGNDVQLICSPELQAH